MLTNVVEHFCVCSKRIVVSDVTIVRFEEESVQEKCKMSLNIGSNCREFLNRPIVFNFFVNDTLSFLNRFTIGILFGDFLDPMPCMLGIVFLCRIQGLIESFILQKSRSCFVRLCVVILQLSNPKLDPFTDIVIDGHISQLGKTSNNCFK